MNVLGMEIETKICLKNGLFREHLCAFECNGYKIPSMIIPGGSVPIQENTIQMIIGIQENRCLEHYIDDVYLVHLQKSDPAEFNHLHHKLFSLLIFKNNDVKDEEQLYRGKAEVDWHFNTYQEAKEFIEGFISYEDVNK